LGGMYFVEKLDQHYSQPPVKRQLFYKCTDEERENLGLDYDKWCIGWVLYELTTQGVDNTKSTPKFSFTSSTSYLTSGKDLSAYLNPKYAEFNAILKE
jgi:hypothetical protein